MVEELAISQHYRALSSRRLHLILMVLLLLMEQFNAGKCSNRLHKGRDRTQERQSNQRLALMLQAHTAQTPVV